MGKVHSLFLALCLLVAPILPTLAAETWMPHGSYLPRSVSSIHEFAQLLREDREVAQRFADHYGINNDAIAKYVEKNGKVVIVSKPTYFEEYYFDRIGVNHKHRKLVGPGHKVLVVQGTAILDMMCGNPIGRTLPSIPPQPKPVVQLPPPVVEKVSPQVEVTEIIPPPAAKVAPETPPLVAMTPPAPAPVSVPPSETVSRRSAFPWWLPFGGLPFIHNGHKKPPPPPPVVPEASSLALGVGGMGFLITYLKRRRR